MISFNCTCHFKLSESCQYVYDTSLWDQAKNSSIHLKVAVVRPSALDHLSILHLFVIVAIELLMCRNTCACSSNMINPKVCITLNEVKMTTH